MLSPRQIILVAGVGLALYGAVTVARPQIDFFMMTGRLFPIRKVELLHSPVAVKSWNESGILLEDGRNIMLPGFKRLPKSSDALAEISKRGLEINPEGRVYGLVKIWHWCGNDPVREHIARVDVAGLLAFLQEGELVKPVDESSLSGLPKKGGRFSEHGLNVSDYGHFEAFCEMRKESN